MAEAGETFANAANVPENDDFYDENPIVKILRGFEVSEETVQKIRESDVLPRDLSALSHDDLKLFGVENTATRSAMLAHFSTFSNQEKHFDKYLEEMDVDQYQYTIYKNVNTQLEAMNRVLEASQLALKSCPIVYDKLADDTVYVSQLNVKAIQEIIKTVSRISNTAESNRWNFWLISMAAFALVSSFTAIKMRNW